MYYIGIIGLLASLFPLIFEFVNDVNNDGGRCDFRVVADFGKTGIFFEKHPPMVYVKKYQSLKCYNI